jgi:hypothetical protein
MRLSPPEWLCFFAVGIATPLDYRTASLVRRVTTFVSFTGDWRSSGLEDGHGPELSRQQKETAQGVVETVGGSSQGTATSRYPLTTTPCWPSCLIVARPRGAADSASLARRDAAPPITPTSYAIFGLLPIAMQLRRYGATFQIRCWPICRGVRCRSMQKLRSSCITS